MKREDIYRVCLKKMAENDPQNVSLQTIADELGVKKASLYEYFTSKEEMLKSSLAYAAERLKIGNFSVDFSADFRTVVTKMIKHYASLFQDDENRSYLACILRLDEYRLRDYNSIEDIIYIFETQVFFVITELSEKKKITPKSSAENLSHIIALLILEKIITCSYEEKFSWEIEETVDIICDLV